MSRTRKIVLGLAVVALLGVTAAVGVARSQDRAVEVRVEEVQERDLEATITATGSVRARRQVNISSDVMGRVIELNVEEGDEVDAGDVLLEIDPSQIRAAVSRARAALSQARAQVSQQQANLLQAQRDLERVRLLRDSDPGLVSVQRLQEAETQVEVQQSLLESAHHGVEQAQAGLEEAEDQLGRTTIRAPISGRVTRLNIEAGETVVVGTMNNPGSLLLTISDLSVIEALLAVDETDIPRVSVGDSARVELDAFPGEGYAATVTRIGSSAIRSGAAAGNQAGAPTGGSVDYEVILTLLDPPALLRPDLSAVADIVVDSRSGVLAVPIISVTVLDDEDEEPQEGVFVVRDGVAGFRPVELGITGREYFEVRSGLSVGDRVVSGPFQRIRELRDGQAVRVEPGGTRVRE
jgi:HlyD family secretion protein